MSFSPDGRILASAGWDSKVTLREVTTGRELTNHLVGHAGAIPSVAFSPDGRALASGSRDGTVMIWDVTDAAKPSLQHKLNANAGSVWAVAYSPDGKSIASGHADGTVKLWDPVTERERCTLVGHTGPVRDPGVLAQGISSGHGRCQRRNPAVAAVRLGDGSPRQGPRSGEEGGDPRSAAVNLALRRGARSS